MNWDATGLGNRDTTLMPQLTHRQTAPHAYRVSVDGVEIGSISLKTRHLHRASTYWHWGVDVMPLMDHGGGVPSGDIEPPGGFEDALKAFKEAFTQWRAGVPDDTWRENLEHKRAGQERWRR
jgi:hypothetical protein